MKNSKILGICCFIMLFASMTLYAQHGGFTGPMAFGHQQFGQTQAAFTGQQGFWGPTMSVTVAQLVQTFPNKASAVLTGYIVQQINKDRYLFRDSSGDMIIKIKNDRWWGLSVGPNDLIEIGGELKRDKKTMWVDYFDAKSVRRAM